jgi:hypothetical protein
MYSIVPGWCECCPEVIISIGLSLVSDSGRAQHFHIKAYPQGYIASNGTFVANSTAVQ